MDIDVCIGQIVARLEVEAILPALVGKVDRIDIAGAPSAGSTTRCAGSSGCR
jgi:cytochrome P450